MDNTQEKSHTPRAHPGPSCAREILHGRPPYGFFVLPSGTERILKLCHISDTHDAPRPRPYHAHSCGGGLHYAAALALLERFRAYWRAFHCEDHTNEPLFVWISHPAHQTKINPAHVFARGFSPRHILFLETSCATRALAPLLQETRDVNAIVLDGHPRGRILNLMARRWLNPAPQAPATLVPADQLLLAQGMPTGGPLTTSTELTQHSRRHPRLFVVGGGEARQVTCA